MSEVCQVCGKVHGKRINLGVTCESEELQSMELIINKLNCAQQAANPNAIPPGTPQPEAKMFIQAAIDSLGNYKWLESDWWNNAKKKYNLPDDKNVFIDFDTGDFYFNEE